MAKSAAQMFTGFAYHWLVRKGLLTGNQPKRDVVFGLVEKALGTKFSGKDRYLDALIAMGHKKAIAMQPTIKLIITPKQKVAPIPSATPKERAEFYDSREWREVRYQALKANDGRCELCGASKAEGAQLHVDHIFPRSKFPALELLTTNLQVLCRDCNLGKSNKDTTDWRRKSAEPIDDEFSEIRRRLGEDM